MDQRHQQNQNQNQHLQDVKIFAQVPNAPCLQTPFAITPTISEVVMDSILIFSSTIVRRPATNAKLG